MDIYIPYGLIAIVVSVYSFYKYKKRRTAQDNKRRKKIKDKRMANVYYTIKQKRNERNT